MFDGHPEGICSVAFNSAEDADRAIDGLDKRLFRGRTLAVKRWDGHTVYTIEETQAEIENRDSAWKEWLEDDEDEETDY
jgi:HIV Tat-specific factor 1